MKRTITLLLIAVLALGLLAGCDGSKKPASDFQWTREGYFTDENENMLYVLASEDPDNPGWFVGCFFGEEDHGWTIQQEGETLSGNLTDPDSDEPAFNVTVSEEGEDGLLLVTEDGTEYHFVPMDVPEAKFSVQINTEGMGQIAYAEEGETPEFDDEYPAQSAYLNLAEDGTYVFAAKADEGYKFVKWTMNGEDVSTDSQITVELNQDAEYIAVFEVAD